MKNNKRHLIKKRIHEVDVKKNYSGEASPYWDFMVEHHDLSDKQIEGQEDPLANPDVLSEDKALHNRPLTEQGELQMQAVHETMDELTPQQQKIVRLTHEGVWSQKDGERFYTEQAIANAIGVSRTTVQDCLNRIKTKIRRRYEKLKATKE